MSEERRTPPKTRAPRLARVAATRKTAPPAPLNEAEFMARAWAMELDAAERYATLADAMEEHNNPEVAELFRKLARIEQLHADRILEEHLGRRAPELPPGGLQWEGGAEGPETADPGELHYRMQPYHALEIALACERRAYEYFSRIARNGSLPEVRKAAREMAAEEKEHVRLIEDWLKRTPAPRKDWAEDPDPPVDID
jgi:rubrerythrin